MTNFACLTQSHVFDNIFVVCRCGHKYTTSIELSPRRLQEATCPKCGTVAELQFRIDVRFPGLVKGVKH